MTARLARLARRDLDEAVAFIAADNPAAAQAWFDGCVAKLALIASVPGLGAPLGERPGLRVAVHGRYLVVYRTRGADVTILRIIHGARDWRRLV